MSQVDWDPLNTFSMVGNLDTRKLARLEPEDNQGIGVSTVAVTDMAGFPYETAILHEGEPSVIIVERYRDQETALARHDYWVTQAQHGVIVTHLGVMVFGIIDLEDQQVTIIGTVDT